MLVCAAHDMVTSMPPVETHDRPCRILIIEDDPDDVYLFQKALRTAETVIGAEVETEHVDNGLDAVFLVSREDQLDRLPDALVLDLNMPRLDGMSFLRSLRNSLALRDLPVFVLTTTSASSIHAEAMQAGADKVYVKPNDGDQLAAIAMDVVHGALSRRSANPRS